MGEGELLIYFLIYFIYIFSWFLHNYHWSNIYIEDEYS